MCVCVIRTPDIPIRSVYSCCIFIIGFSNLSVFMFCLRFFLFTSLFVFISYVLLWFFFSLLFFLLHTNILVVAFTLSYVTINLLCVHHDTRPSFIVVHCCMYTSIIYFCICDCMCVCAYRVWLCLMPMTCLLSVCYYFYLFSVLFNV